MLGKRGLFHVRLQFIRVMSYYCNSVNYRRVQLTLFCSEVWMGGGVKIKLSEILLTIINYRKMYCIMYVT